MTAVRFAFSFAGTWWHLRSEFHESFLLTVTLVSSRASVAPPLKRPAAFASLTTPSARARPLGMADLAFDFNGRFDRRRELVAGFVWFFELMV